MHITQRNHIDDIKTKGYTFLPGLIKPDHVNAILDSVHPHVEQAEVGYGTAKTSQITFAMFRTPQARQAMRDIIFMPETSDIFAHFMERPFVEHTKILVKAPGGPDTPWHQDAAFWESFDPEKTMLSLWIALEPVTIANGCMNMVEPSSALNAILPHTKVRNGKELEIPSNDVDSLLNDGKEVSLEMQPGDALIFNSTTIHKALPNTTDNPRMAIKIVFQDRTRRAKGVAKHPSYIEMNGVKGWMNKINPCCLTARRM